jgi:trimeric autotransporter adhesin
MWNRIRRYLASGTLAVLAALPLAAAEHHGVVKFGGLPLPGATVTLSQGEKKLVAVSDGSGAYSFPDVADGTWKLQVDMLCFTPIEQEVAIAPGAPSPDWEMKMLPLDQIKASAPPPSQPTTPPTASPNATVTARTPAAATPGATSKPSIAGAEQAAANGKGKNAKGKNAKGTTATPANASNGFQRTDVNATPGGSAPPPDSGIGAAASSSGDSGSASDAMVVNGSVSNGIERRVIGNARKGPGALYRGDVQGIFSNSYLNAHTYSLTGQNTPQPAYNNLRFGGSVGGPLYIPHILKSNGQIFFNYMGTRSRNASNTTTNVPTLAERGGDFSQSLNLLGQPLTIIDPDTGAPFPGNIIPQNRISPVATRLLGFYPQANFVSALGYNYQAPLTNIANSDAAQARFNRNLDRKNFINGSFGFQRGDGVNTNLFGFVDPSESLGMQGTASYRHMFNQRINGSLTYTYSRGSNRTTPYFATLNQNVSGLAGIQGNDQSPNNYGPPSLGFTSGISGLNDAQQQFTRNQTSALGYNMLWIKRPHNITIGGDFRRMDLNMLSQSNGRGGFQFTGAATQQTANGVAVPNTGFGFADFLLNRPDTASLAMGNADKYFRTSSYDAFITDDWRVGPSLSINYGMRWEYSSPITEKYGRLVNLDVHGFYAAVAPVVGNAPTGPLTGNKYPDSLVQPDKHGFEPRVALAWHPIFGSSLVVRAGYGVYYDTSAYQSLASQMAQQWPLSRNLSLFGTAAAPLSMITALTAVAGTNTFAVDPNFHIGYSQNWQVSAQRDLPGGHVITLTYLGIKGTRAAQAFIPNTYPNGAVNPCSSCPTNFVYVASNGNSTREAGQVQLQRRFHNGLSASVNYTFSKALDDAALGGRGQGGQVIAQNWLDLRGERGFSQFDQRHLMTFTMQYTSGVGVKGGTLLSGWRGVALKRWTVVTNLTAGSGKPETPTYSSYIPAGTAISGPIRPEYTGAPVYDAPPGRFLNPAAYIAPLPGQWGNAGRYSIIGPNQFAMNASMQRTFEDVIDVRLDATNALNHVTYPSWNANASSAQFGLPNQPLAMRSVQLTLRWRF